MNAIHWLRWCDLFWSTSIHQCQLSRSNHDTIELWTFTIYNWIGLHINVNEGEKNMHLRNKQLQIMYNGCFKNETNSRELFYLKNSKKLIGKIKKYKKFDFSKMKFKLKWNKLKITIQMWWKYEWKSRNYTWKYERSRSHSHFLCLFHNKTATVPPIMLTAVEVTFNRNEKQKFNWVKLAGFPYRHLFNTNRYFSI